MSARRRKRLLDLVAFCVSAALIGLISLSLHSVARTQQRHAAAIAELQQRIPFSRHVGLEVRRLPGDFLALVAMGQDGSEQIVELWREQRP